MKSNDPLLLSPLTESTYYILISLVDPLHGYGIIKKVQSLSRERIVLSPGTLYGVLQNLMDHGLISLKHAEDSGRQKKIYQITPTGKMLARFEIQRLQEMVIHGKGFLHRAGMPEELKKLQEIDGSS